MTPSLACVRACSIKAALIMCICDSPAARKISGTPGITGTYFCTRCWCHKDELHDVDKGECVVLF